MNNFAKFLSVNDLKRKDIASFLGVSGAFITQITSGDRPLPDEKLAMIKANAFGWDVSMLTQPKNSMGEQPTSDNGYIRRLKEELDEVKAERDALLQEIAVLKYQLAQKGGIAPSAGDSLSASAI